MNLTDITALIRTARVFDNRRLGLAGSYVAVLSAHAVHPGDDLRTVVTPARGPLNDRVNADAQERARRYLSQGIREALPESVVYYVTNKNTGEVVNAITANGTVLGGMSTPFQSRAAWLAVTAGFNAQSTETRAYLFHSESEAKFRA